MKKAVTPTKGVFGWLSKGSKRSSESRKSPSPIPPQSPRPSTSPLTTPETPKIPEPGRKSPIPALLEPQTSSQSSTSALKLTVSEPPTAAAEGDQRTENNQEKLPHTLGGMNAVS